MDGRHIERIKARGKHLFYLWDDDQILHVHLGLFGRFVLGRTMVPGPNARVAWHHENDGLALSGPTICELIDADRADTIIESLGPDPLHDSDPSAPTAIWQRLQRRATPIAAALLDQSLVAGIGNVYRSELLFLAGIDPQRRADSLSEDEVVDLWELTVSQLQRGERLGRIVTVPPELVGVAGVGDMTDGDRLYVYKRTGEPCRRCGREIKESQAGNRSVWNCPTCQR